MRPHKSPQRLIGEEVTGDNVARTEEGGEKDPGDVGGPEEEGGETQGLLREDQG